MAGDRDGPPDSDIEERYVGYWHGFTFLIFDMESDDDEEAWIRSTHWVPVAQGSEEAGGDTD